MVEPFRVKLTLLLFAMLKLLNKAFVVPALIRILVRLVATEAEAVMVEPFNPKITLFELEKTVAPGTV